MQAGFALLESGSVGNVKNTQGVLMKNVMDLTVGAIGWMTVGFVFLRTV